MRKKEGMAAIIRLIRIMYKSYVMVPFLIKKY